MTAPGGLAPATGSIRLAAQHFAASAIYLLAGTIGLVWIAPELARGQYISPHVAGITHLFTLGWLTTTIFGALCQSLPVALGSPLPWPRLADLGFWVYAPGVAVFAFGVATENPVIRMIGVLLVAAGILVIVSNLAAGLIRATRRDVTWAAVAIALTFLLSTLALGLVLVHNLETGFVAAARLRVLATHLHVALVGWILVMIVGVSHRLLPMFLLAHGGDTRWTRPALALLASGVVVLAAGLLAAQPVASWLGLILIEGGIVCFLRQAYAFYRVRVRRKLDAGLRFAATALAFLLVTAGLAPAVLAIGATHPHLAVIYLVTGLLGGIVLYVVGFFYKIVPLLAWTGRFRGRMGKGPVPTVAQMYSARLAYGQLGAMAIGVIALAAGIAIGQVHVVRCGAVLYLIGLGIFMLQLLGIAFGRVLPAAAPVSADGAA
jgi:hypothetical protein